MIFRKEDVILDSFDSAFGEKDIYFEALARLLIEKGILSGSEIDEKIREIKGKKRDTCESDFFQTPLLVENLNTNNTASPDKNENSLHLPGGLKIINRQIAFTDNATVSGICGKCIAQNDMNLESIGVIDICGLPELLMKDERLSPKKVLKGVNSSCWLSVVGEKILSAVKKELITREELPEIMGKAAKQVKTAKEQDINNDGIINIIECAVLVEKIDEKEADSILHVSERDPGENSTEDDEMEKIFWAD